MLHIHAIVALVIFGLLCAQAVAFYVYVLPRIRAVRASAAPGSVPAVAIAGVRAKLVGFKHSLLAGVGGLALALPDLLAYVKGMDLSGTALAQYAPIVGLVCFVGLMIFNAMGMQTALHAKSPAE